MDEKNQKIIKYIVIALAILIAYFSYEDQSNRYDNALTQIEILTDENKELESKFEESENKVESLEKELNYNVDLVELLRDQLYEHNIEPYEL